MEFTTYTFALFFIPYKVRFAFLLYAFTATLLIVPLIWEYADAYHITFTFTSLWVPYFRFNTTFWRTVRYTFT